MKQTINYSISDEVKSKVRKLGVEVYNGQSLESLFELIENLTGCSIEAWQSDETSFSFRAEGGVGGFGTVQSGFKCISEAACNGIDFAIIQSNMPSIYRSWLKDLISDDYFIYFESTGWSWVRRGVFKKMFLSGDRPDVAAFKLLPW